MENLAGIILGSSHCHICSPKLRSLELFFATNQNNRSSSTGSEQPNEKSPRLCRKFSSPPPLSIPSHTSSPVRARKLSLNSPLSSRVVALDLSNPVSYSAANSPTSPPPSSNIKSPQDPSPEQSPGANDDSADTPRIDAVSGKLRRSIRRGKIASLLLVQKEAYGQGMQDLFFLILPQANNTSNHVFTRIIRISTRFIAIIVRKY